MRNFEFIFSIELFQNETAVFADIILPDQTYLESWALLMCEPPMTEGLNCRQPVVKSPGTCRDSFDILAELAERLGKTRHHERHQRLYLRAWSTIRI